MSWRLARSLIELRAEVRERWPGTTVWTIGDAAHAGRASDHNPNPQGIVCAVDIVGSPARIVWNHLRERRDPRVKYMIHDGQIVSSTVSPWSVRAYTGSNPHRNHVHVSVGRGPDGRSTRPDLYEASSPWGLLAGSKQPPASTPHNPPGDALMAPLGYTRIDNGAPVYAILASPGATFLVHVSRPVIEAAAVTNGWGRWQDHVGNVSRADVNREGLIVVGG